jgi:hypothetical protein
MKTIKKTLAILMLILIYVLVLIATLIDLLLYIPLLIFRSKHKDYALQLASAFADKIMDKYDNY